MLCSGEVFEDEEGVVGVDNMRDYHIDWDVPDSISSRYKGKFDADLYASGVFSKLGKQIVKKYVKKMRPYNDGSVRWGMLKKAKLGLIQSQTAEGFSAYGNTKQ